jgi:hypothetical protein
MAEFRNRLPCCGSMDDRTKPPIITEPPCERFYAGRGSVDAFGTISWTASNPSPNKISTTPAER